MTRRPNAWLLMAVAAVACVVWLSRAHAQVKSNSQTPLIVRQISLRDPTASLSTFTIFTPTTAGLYRISAYGELNVADPNGNCVNGGFNWTDDAGKQVSQLFPNLNLCITSQSVAGEIVIYSKANEPVTLNVSADPFAGQYSLFITIEQM